MAPETKSTEESSALRSRDSIDDNLKWNLTDLYADDDAWEKDFKNAREMITKADGFIGKVTSSSAVLFQCLEMRTELSRVVGDLFQYAKLNLDLDNRVSKYQAMVDRVAMLDATASAAFSFLEPELLKADEAKLLKLADGFEKTDHYDFYIKELIRSRSHIRSNEVEELLAQSAMIARGPDSIFSMLNDADLTYPSIKDEDGVEVQLTKQRFAKFLESGDARVRKDANDNFYKVYRDHVNALGASLAAQVNADIFYSRARRFDSSLHAALDRGNIPVSVYQSLIEATENNLSGLHNYVNLRKRALGLDKIKPYDMMCPLCPDRDYEVPYDQAATEVVKALKPLGDEYCATLQKAFDSRWVDAYETDGKGSGAYSWGNYRTHPFVLMNYNDTVDNMFTLAHEMGHALHSHLSNKTQPLPKAQYSIFVAEVASTLNEGLLARHLLKKATDDRERLYILNRQIDNTVGTFFNQVMYAHFELAIHDAVEKGQALAPDMLTDLWRELTQKYYGDGMTVDELSILKWSRIPHFYMNFYVYQYATSYAASQAILDKFLSGEEGIIKKYLGLLAAGGSDYPIEILKQCGVDMGTAGPVEANLRLFEKQVAQADKLIK
jgi:oligoendopeptidase F